MFEKNYATGGGVPSPTSFFQSRYIQHQVMGLTLSGEINEFFWLGETPSSTNINVRQAPVAFNTTVGLFAFRLTNGAHDAEITLTLQIDGSSTTKVATIPASVGAGTFTEDTNVSVAALEQLTFIIEGGGGAGTTSLNGYSLEFQ